MTYFLETLREENNLTQEHLAKKLEVSRPTIQKILSGKKDPSFVQTEKLSAIFNIALESFSQKKIISNTNVFLQKEKPKKQQEKPFRISVPQQNIKKFKEVFLYITQKVGAFPNVGQTVLYKLLYFCDFDYYEKHEEQIIGSVYMKNTYGPTPIAFKKIINKMIEKKEIKEVKYEYFGHDQTKYLPLVAPDLNCFSAREIKHIDETLERLATKTAVELSNLSHKDVPWITAKTGEIVDYEAVFYRTSETSVRTYDNAVL